MTQLLYAAWDLGLFQLLSKAPLTLAEICERLALPRHSTDMLLNTCVALGLLKKEDGSYANTPLSENYLVAENTFYLGGLLEHFRRHVFPAWDSFKEAIQQDRPQIVGDAGKSDIFEATRRPDVDTELFIAAMHNLSVSDGLILAEGFDFSPFTRLLDIGGGSGALSLAVAERHPRIQAVVFDRPQVCSIAERYIQAAGLGSRVSTRPGDAFSDALPERADVVVLSLFIHAFGLKRSTPILEKCLCALPPGGCVLIYEPMLYPGRTGPLTTLLSSLNMLLVTPSGGDVTAQDYMQWLEKLGFESVFYKALPSIRHLVGGFKPKA
ncbi:MAG: hypothetical protein A2992_06910 [Elusimicrobia bacterium RIFCSPLOWO2_01_FULL_59_12]|nr:MAG: hypothetical protein A2992_06910 [Elusimicrobia bacterium RIFCSPLOWO2_01_FULL_59_12]